MYRPSQTPRLAVSSNRITRERISAPVTTHHNVARNVRANGRTKQHGREVRNATLRAWLKNTVTVAARERTTHAFRLTE
ncbi:hypothetical protein TcasGA2_TC032713 [Tribolium castaneum]|uniref:Uncharacterized protein n=1 Tax=Tribolium castaneum TaxID=7070 RepID=D7ELX6_TRICA|nr:hypothetical protein TcasGA2_TC004335 [Tribolium castaneum]KXZ75560.1 hypothetical protein TcasGA2_TC032281 [Tribolium castaneum]KXZ75915.1 hypothetical protein TcasGA2_TC032713 [Tribolium castaneum]